MFKIWINPPKRIKDWIGSPRFSIVAVIRIIQRLRQRYSQTIVISPPYFGFVIMTKCGTGHRSSRISWCERTTNIWPTRETFVKKSFGQGIQSTSIKLFRLAQTICGKCGGRDELNCTVGGQLQTGFTGIGARGDYAPETSAGTSTDLQASKL